MILINFIFTLSLWIGINPYLIPYSVSINFQKNNLCYGGELSFSTKLDLEDNKFESYQFSISMGTPLRYIFKRFYILSKPSFQYTTVKSDYGHTYKYTFDFLIGSGLLWDFDFKILKLKISIESDIISGNYGILERDNEINTKSYIKNLKFNLFKSPVRFFVIFNL